MRDGVRTEKGCAVCLSRHVSGMDTDAKMRLTLMGEPHFCYCVSFAENRWFYWLFAIAEAYSGTDIQTFLLVEVTLQQALESLAVTGLVQ